MPKWNHAIDVAFEIETDNDANNITVEEMLAGMRKRLEYLESHPTEAKEAFGVFDTFEIDSQFV